MAILDSFAHKHTNTCSLPSLCSRISSFSTLVCHILQMKDYEKEKARLEEKAELGGVKGMMGKNELAQLGASPLMEKINKVCVCV